MTSLSRRSLVRSSAALGLGASLGALQSRATAGSAPALVRAGRPLLTHGVQAGDPTAGTISLWSRADRASRLVAEVSTDPAFKRVRRISGPIVGDSSDFTGQIPVAGLPSGAELHYRITAVDLQDPSLSSEQLTVTLKDVDGQALHRTTLDPEVR